MKECDTVNFAKLMALMGNLYNKQMPKNITDLYWDSLKQFEFLTVQKAFSDYTSNPDNCKFFPLPGNIRKFIQGSGESKSLQAWSIVQHTITHVGSYDTIVFDDALIHSVIIEMGGWVKLCQTKTNDLSFRSNEFQKRYNALLIISPNQYIKCVYGILKNRDPVFIGNIDKAKLIFNGKIFPLKSIKNNCTSLSRNNENYG